MELALNLATRRLSDRAEHINLLPGAARKTRQGAQSLQTAHDDAVSDDADFIYRTAFSHEPWIRALTGTARLPPQPPAPRR